MGGHIQKTVGARWQIDYRDGQGRRHRATFDTKKEADNALTDIKSRIGKGEYVSSKLLPKFRELAEDWFRSKGDRRPGTVGNWRAQIDLHLNPKLGDLRLDRIDVVLIEKLRDELRAKLSAKSVNAVLTTAAAIFKLAVRRKLATGNPAADAERAFMGATELKDEATKEQRGDGVQPLRPEEVLDPNEIRKVLEKSQPGYYRTLFLTAYLTGM
jgi:integrase-like protein